MADTKERGKQRLNTVNPNSVVFGLLSSEEILQLSVAKITTSQTFDILGHPISGGLYDPLLGPIDKFSSCATCLNNIFNCPGHFGHIELPLPVINPFFYNVVVKLLQMICLKCHNFLIPFRNKFILINQLRLLADGNINEALQFESYFNKKEGVPADFNRDIYDDMIKKLNDSHSSKVVKNDGVLKNTVIESKGNHQMRESFIAGTVRLVSRTTCSNCFTKVQKLRMYQKQILTNVKVEVAEKFKEVGDRNKSLSVGGQTFIMPSETLVHLRKTWRNDSTFLSELFPVLKTTSIKYPTDMLFITTVLVPPSNVRPANYLRGSVSEHLQNKIYKTIIDDSFVVRTLVSLMKDDDFIISDDCKLMISKLQGSSYPEKLQFAWHSLQMDCELLLSQDPKNKRNSDTNGLKQILEKKEGIIRMHMMGKRVNFAARSVITPDPNLNIDEIGIPEAFAKKLTYPVPVTPWNVKILRKMVINGPDVHPGATIVELEDGTKIRILADNSTQRESIANQLMTPGGSGNDKNAGIKTLHRHLINGDVLLMNRQPTLHKPSIMAHRARVLKGEKTIRLHYSNCKSYNADFDGDEMNAHFPQNELARSEGYNIVSVCNQYLVPKDGTPLGGLIQDHMISGVRLSVRGRFFTRDDYMQLVFQALPYVHGDIQVLPPAIIKPIKLWSGKQIISTVILNIIPKGKNAINLISTAKINSKAWIHGKERKWKAGGTPFKNPNTMSEAEVIIRSGELLCGVLDKTHYGSTPYSLIHCVYELYGGECSCKLLSAFGKLFAAFLQTEGFTLGVKDILVTKQADKERLVYMKAIKKIGNEAATKALDLPLDTDKEELKFKLEEAYRKDPKFRQTIDRQYKNSLDSFTNKINTACVPNGLIERFPYNNLQLMVQSGAKGSTVNTMQISCLLGQIELEGKRPPLMISGRSLPSFSPYETTARSGGFIDGRFMTGIQPQEFFFHCMAGREGLIDTAVKTSRSGYLQRCLIKHLEGISVKYDMTVRDSDGSVVQYLYGEDGMDVTKAQFFKESQVPFLVANSQVIVNEDALNKVQNETIKDGIKKYHKKMKSWNKYCQDVSVPLKKITPFDLYCRDMEETVSKVSIKVSKKTGRSKKAIELCKRWFKLDEETKSGYYKKCKRCPHPLISQYQPDRDFGVISERLDSLMDDYLRKRSGNVSSNHKKRLQDMINFKSMTSMCSPGEPVGILAAQSIGEPSTQMTLNTFHFAGRGEMNVTLGIPRLREILMMASKTIKTPSVEVPFKKNVPRLEKGADKLRKHLTRITLGDVLEYASVTERQILEEPNRRQLYDIYFKLLPTKAYNADTHIKPRHILEHIEKVFLKVLIKRGPMKRDSLITEGQDKVRKSRSKKSEEDDQKINAALDDDPSPQDLRKRVESESSEEEIEADDDDATTTKIRARRVEEQEYQEKEEEDEEEIKDDSDLYGETQEDNESDKDDAAEIDEQEETRRTEFVIESNESVENYRFDTENQMWCEVTLSYPHYVGRIDFGTVLRERASASVIHEVPGIRRAFVYESDDKLMLKTDGLNFPEIFRHDNILDINKLYSNDIHGIAQTYGIEAAAKIIVKEVQEVFKVYGITVDPRHLLLVADYMTFDGTIQPLNRTGIMGNVSPLQQMSFESSSGFLKSAVLLGRRDDLNSPSSCLFVGQPCKVGTGIVDCRLSSSIFLST